MSDEVVFVHRRTVSREVGWYFVDDDQQLHGPFESREIATAKRKAHERWLDSPVQRG